MPNAACKQGGPCNVSVITCSVLVILIQSKTLSPIKETYLVLGNQQSSNYLRSVKMLEVPLEACTGFLDH